ncbi:hypothetical protein PAN31108_03267 [Pandoraea anhela]|uniref:Uncharacterized protein n=1 Tax=Pandoraea anhela TaxID=2508295 RepID=A0A5E4WHS0_9BURK|nr:hypothetical protein PAN31108_03267 [Pandoraea anhela]
MTPGEALTNAISPALSLLPTKMDTPQARVMLARSPDRFEHQR